MEFVKHDLWLWHTQIMIVKPAETSILINSSVYDNSQFGWLRGTKVKLRGVRWFSAFCDCKISLIGLVVRFTPALYKATKQGNNKHAA